MSPGIHRGRDRGQDPGTHVAVTPVQKCTEAVIPGRSQRRQPRIKCAGGESPIACAAHGAKGLGKFITFKELFRCGNNARQTQSPYNRVFCGRLFILSTAFRMKVTLLFLLLVLIGKLVCISINLSASVSFFFLIVYSFPVMATKELVR